MSMAGTEHTYMVLSIIARGKCKRYQDMLKEHGIRVNYQMIGFGTAPSEMMDILGLGTNDKDVVISIATENAAGSLLAEYSQDLERRPSYNGLMVVVRLSALGRLAAEVAARSREKCNDREEHRVMKSEKKYNLILIAVNQGYADSVMQAARKAGATGGTIIRARMADAGLLSQLDDADPQEEKEIITILAAEATCGRIMEEVNQAFGLRTDAKGIVCAMPVEKAMKI